MIPKTTFPLINGLQLITLLLLTYSCNQTKTADDNEFEQAVRNEAIEYFETFAERSDWDKFCSFYREDLHFKDIML
jgi:Tfp pilus assembly protein PilP